jgi:hypothetical protein
MFTSNRDVGNKANTVVFYVKLIAQSNAMTKNCYFCLFVVAINFR